MERFRLAVDGDAKVVTMKHGGQSNRKIRRIMDLAGVEPWADAFQTLRSSREQIWCDEFSQSVVSKWIGHSITVSGKHYANRALDHHFDAASKRSSKAAQNAAQHVPAAPCTGLHRKMTMIGVAAELPLVRTLATQCALAQVRRIMEPGGVEPPCLLRQPLSVQRDANLTYERWRRIRRTVSGTRRCDTWWRGGRNFQ
jgi:hypothetical protein